MSHTLDMSNVISGKATGFGVRHFQIFLTFFCLFIAHIMSANLSVGIVAMTTSKENSSSYLVLPWTISQQGIILSSFYWGNLFPQIIAGLIVQRVGLQYLLNGSMLICSLVSLLLPVLALQCSWVVVCLSRVVNGFSQGFILPGVSFHLSKWAPPSERSRIYSFVFGGSQLGNVVANAVGGYLAASVWGWPSIFYVSGLCGLLWSATWLLFGSDSPETHTTIGHQERNYLASCINITNDHSKMATPWREMFTSIPLWALVFAHFGFCWGYLITLTFTPNYLSHVFGFSIEKNGLLSSLPYVAIWLLLTVFSWAADFINEKEILSLSVNRKMWNSIGVWGGSAFLASMSFTDSAVAGVVLITASIGISAGIFSGFLINHSELAPNFAGLIMGITNTFATLASILGPLSTGYIVRDETSKADWMLAFNIGAAIMFMSNAIFVLFGSTEVQPWNTPKKSAEEEHQPNSPNDI